VKAYFDKNHILCIEPETIPEEMALDAWGTRYKEDISEGMIVFLGVGGWPSTVPEEEAPF
tara:strand:- start:2950 stop:3129 length:180 start_codon:yes stop_codon:yes gene_type:complete